MNTYDKNVKAALERLSEMFPEVETDDEVVNIVLSTTCSAVSHLSVVGHALSVYGEPDKTYNNVSGKFIMNCLDLLSSAERDLEKMMETSVSLLQSKPSFKAWQESASRIDRLMPIDMTNLSK